MKQENINKGFTLIELLVTLGILAIIVGMVMMYFIKTQDDANKTSEKINESSVLAAANYYTNEFESDMTWRKETETSSEQYSCLLIDEVIDQGFLSSSEVTDEYKKNYRIKVIKSKDNVNKYELVESAKCNIIDKTPPIIEITANKFTSKDNWSKENITLTATAEDKESGIVAYQLKEKNSTDNNWTEINNPKNTFKTTLTIGKNGETTYVFKVKNGSDLETTKEYTVYIDNEGPVYEGPTNIPITIKKDQTLPTATYTDKGSGVDKVLYKVITIESTVQPSAPDPITSNFTTTPKITSYECGKTINLYSMAIDKAGNTSTVTKLIAKYYEECPKTTSSTKSSSSRNKNSSSSSSTKTSTTSSCDTVCQMKKNSEAWHDATTKAEKDALHQKNVELGKTIGLNESTNFTSSGNWTDNTGKNLYEVSGGSKNKTNTTQQKSITKNNTSNKNTTQQKSTVNTNTSKKNTTQQKSTVNTSTYKKNTTQQKSTAGKTYTSSTQKKSTAKKSTKK